MNFARAASVALIAGMAVLFAACTTTGDSEETVSERFAMYGGQAVVLVDSQTERQNRFAVDLARALQGPSGSAALAQVETLVVEALDATVADLLKLRGLEPEKSQFHTDELLEAALSAERDFFFRMLAIVQEGFRVTNSGQNWTFPDDAELSRHASRLEQAASDYNTELDRLVEELGLLDD